MLASEAASSMLLLASGFSTISREDVSEEGPEVQAARRGLPQPTGIAAGLSTLTVEELRAGGADNNTLSIFWQTSASAFWPPHAESRDLRRATALVSLISSALEDSSSFL